MRICPFSLPITDPTYEGKGGEYVRCVLPTMLQNLRLSVMVDHPTSCFMAPRLVLGLGQVRMAKRGRSTRRNELFSQVFKISNNDPWIVPCNQIAPKSRRS